MPRLILLISTALLSASTFAASPPADQIFPGDTKGFFSIQNLKDFGEQWKQTQFGQLLDDPLMENFKQEIQNQLTERMQNTFGLTLDGIASLPSGEVAFGMLAVPNQVPGYVLTMDVAGKRPETDTYLANLTQKLVSVGVKKSTETYKNQQITILVFPPPEAPPTATPKNTKIELPPPIERRAYYMFFQDVLIASDQLHLLKLIADRIADQTGTSLADLEGYQVTMKRCIGEMPTGVLPSLRWYIEPLDYGESIRTLLRGPASQKRKDKPSIFSILKQQGLGAIQGVGGVVSIKTEAQESVYRTFIYTKKPYRLAMRMFTFPDSTNFAPPIWMPSDLARCTTVFVNPTEIFDNFGVLFDALIMPGEEGLWKGILNDLEKDPHGPQINLREELIAHLGNRVLGMSRYEKPITIKSESIVIAVELKGGSESAMLAGMEKLFGTDPEMQFMPYKSYKIWHRKPLEDIISPIDMEIPTFFNFDDSPNRVHTVPVKSSALSAEEEEDRPPTFPDGGIVVAKNCLFVSTNRDYLKLILDRLDSSSESSGSTIGSEVEYKEVDRIFGSMGITEKPHFFQFFARTQETLRPTYEMIRKNQMAQSEAVMAKLLNGVLSSDEESGVRRQILDGKTMPEFDKVQHYFGTVGIYGVTEENGYFIKGFALEKEIK
ncbi:MAG: DUF3352 domain-containing protein [Planctomycetaceae bacterium]|jgi:hypothetical protein|nr:DUF3352 domain-containing protein [Planctomycetaceae bacterium]